jgi:acyl-coenzyme A synthetase/AMP-(fatty) acid ligase
VLATAVCGEPNALLGAVVVAQVELDSGASAQDAERRIRQHCRSRLPPYQVPVRIELAEGLVGRRQKLQRRAGGTAPPDAFQNW